MRKKHGGGFVPLLCNLIGILLIAAVIAAVLPLVVPRFLGYECYHIESDSMEPEIPVGSIIYVYVKDASAQDIRSGDVIAFYREDTVIAHRVRENRIVEGEFITKGDANPVDDAAAVPYADFIGRVGYHLPVLGRVLGIAMTGIGKVYLLLIAACGVLLNILASRIRYSRAQKQKKAERDAAKNAESKAAVNKDEPETVSADKPRKKKHPVRITVMIILAVIFVGAAVGAGMILMQYHESSEVYREAVRQFVKGTPVRKENPLDSIPVNLRASLQEEKAQPVREQETAQEGAEGIPGTETDGSDRIYTTMEGTNPKIRAQYVRDLDPSLLQAEKKYIRDSRILAPVRVDFPSLLEVNSDVKGWIYCQDTNIDYPVLYGETNDTYLRHTYDKAYNIAGSIFIESENDPNLKDYNTIIYGHHMNDGSMFAGLEHRAEQSYYDEHPVMWLLTPERDYLLVLASGYTTSAYSDTYAVITEPGENLTSYILDFLAKSDFKTDLLLPLDGRYVVLTTCAYVFDNARYVLHGLLVPADSAGGRPLW